MDLKRISILSLVALAGCPQPPPDPEPIAPDAAPPEVQRTEVLSIKATQNPDLDLLFVIDDSPTMMDKQNALSHALPALQAQLEAIPGGMPNLHIGVVTTDMGTSATGSDTPGPSIGSGPGACAGTGDGGALQKGTATFSGTFLTVERNGIRNFTGSLTETIAQLFSVGASGCGFEQPLASMRAALGTNPANTGFLRASANLAVVVLSDEDDCSAHDTRLFSSTDATLSPLNSFRCFQYGVRCAPDDPLAVGTKSGCQPRPTDLLDDVKPYKDFLLGLKNGDERKLMFGAIVGDPTRVAVEMRSPPGGGTATPALEHSCSFQTALGTAVADPGVRFQAMVNDFPGRSLLSSVCSDDLAPSVTSIGRTIRRLVGDSCLEHAIAAPVDCIVEDISDSGAFAPRRLAACGSGSAGDCYELVPDSSCTDGTPLRLAVTRTAAPDDNTWTRVSCTTAQ